MFDCSSNPAEICQFMMIHDVCVCVPKSIGGGGDLCSVQLKH